MKEFIEKQTDVVEEKIKVTSLEIIVTGTKDKPYFQIKYKEVGKEYYNIGYGSYELNYVFGWKEKCFEIVNQLAEEYNNGWIPVSSGNPKETGLYQVTVDDNDEPVITAMYLAEVDIWSYHAVYGNYMKVLAWRSLPQPYQPKGE